MSERSKSFNKHAEQRSEFGGAALPLMLIGLLACALIYWLAR
jgi:hypothetical protein